MFSGACWWFILMQMMTQDSIEKQLATMKEQSSSTIPMQTKLQAKLDADH